MVIYGWNSKVLKESPFPNHTCQSCNSTDSHVVVTGSYFHIFWIPIFPYKKNLSIICASCSAETKPKHVSEEVKQFAKQLKSTVKLPIYMFAGSGLIAALVIFMTISGILDGQKTEEYLQAPQANDIYFLYDKEEPTEYKYSLAKVESVKGDSVYVLYNSFSYNLKPYKLEPEDGFYNVKFGIHKSELQKLYDKDELRSVQRGFDASSGFGREVELTEEDINEIVRDLEKAVETPESKE